MKFHRRTKIYFAVFAMFAIGLAIYGIKSKSAQADEGYTCAGNACNLPAEVKAAIAKQESGAKEPIAKNQAPTSAQSPAQSPSSSSGQAPASNQNQPTSKSIQLLVTNYVDQPETNLGDKHKGRKAQCSVLAFNLESSVINDPTTKSAVYDQLKSKGITAVANLDEFKKADENSWPATIIYEKTRNTNLSCPADSEEYKTLTSSASDASTASNGQEKDKCEVKDGRLMVAINNYPENVTDHSTYTSKMNDKNFRCDKILVPVADPKQGLQKSLAEVEKYLNEQVTGIKVVKDKNIFDQLSGDDMKKAVIVSSLKCDCYGPNSTHYDGIGFKDPKGKVEDRGNLPNSNAIQIGDGLVGNANTSGNSVSIGADPSTYQFEKPDSAAPCLKSSKVTLCFMDKSTQKEYANGNKKVINLVNVASNRSAANISRIKKGRMDHAYIVLGTGKNVQTVTGSTYSPAYTEPSWQSAIGSATQSDVPTGVFVSYYSTTLSASMDWSNVFFADTVDHEWSHAFDGLNGITDSQNSVFNQIYNAAGAGLKNNQTLSNTKKYPDCVFTDLLEINTVIEGSTAVSSGHPQDHVAELFASTFETYSNFMSRFNNFFKSWAGDAKCKSELTKAINEQATYFSK